MVVPDTIPGLRFAASGLRVLPSTGIARLHRYFQPSDFCRLSHLPADLPAYCAQPSVRPARNHPITSLDRLLRHPQRPALLPDFVVKPDDSPRDETESGSSPTDHTFASGCSPHHLAATQLPSATRPWLALAGTSTPPIERPHGRTITLRCIRATSADQAGDGVPRSLDGVKRNPGS